MDNSSEEIIFEPSVLKWAREKGIGLRMEALTIKLEKSWKEVSPELIKSWEEGVRRPTFAEVKKLAEIYKRPLAVFFLDSPPEELKSLPDLRTIGSEDNEDISPEGLLIIRKARRIQELSAGLYEELGEKPVFNYPKHFITENAEGLAEKIRSDLSISSRDQFKFRKYEDFFEYLRTKIEDIGVITLKSGLHDKFPKEDGRAFSFTDSLPYLILINNKDYEGAKNFSLAHELAHILLREAGLCNNFKSFDYQGKKINKLEVFCNQFAASLLVPKEEFLGNKILNGKTKISLEEVGPLVERMAPVFKVSRFVILRRLLTFKLIDKTTYNEKATFWEDEKFPPQKGRAVFSLKTFLKKNGVTFSSLVLEAYRQKKISYVDVSDYLGLKTKHISGFEQLLHSHGR